MKKLSFIVLSMVLFSFITFLNPSGASAQLADGSYSINYTTLDKNKNVSYGDGHFVKPAKLIVKNGSIVAQITIKESEWYKLFSMNAGGNKVLSTDTSANTRLVQFNVSSLSALNQGRVVIELTEEKDGMDYDRDDVIYFQFNQDSLKTLSLDKTSASNSDKTNSENADKSNSTNSNNSTVKNNSTSNGNNDSSNASQITENPQTSDPTQIWLLIGTMLVAGALLLKSLKKENKNV